MAISDRDKYFDDLAEKLGTTENWLVVGFILPDGRLLDLQDDEFIADPNIRAYTHDDMEKFFGYKTSELLENGVMRFGICEVNKIPYVQIVTQNYLPTNAQFKRLGDLLNMEPYMLDVELTRTYKDTKQGNRSKFFYKRYTVSDDPSIIKQDIMLFLDGDMTNTGRTYNEGLGEVDSIE